MREHAGPMSAAAHRDRKGPRYPEAEVTGAVNHLLWALGTEFQSSARAARALLG